MTIRLPLYQVDAFTDRVFAGNPAAVVPLDAWLPDETLLNIALENNLSETAFFVPDAATDSFHLRWFTPVKEVGLCGHATLASAAVVFRHVRPELDGVRFQTLSGELTVTRHEDWYEMDFPKWNPEPVPVPEAATHAFGFAPVAAYFAREIYLVFDSEETIRNLRVDFTAVSELDPDIVVVTAPGGASGADYVVRAFAPNVGIPEDPVTGSIQCALAPIWAERLGRASFTSHQVSQRGGELHVRLDGDRVRIRGQAAFVLEGTFSLPDTR